MAGFREFVTGEVLTAANVNDFLGKQAVMKFADAAARDAALGTAVASGNALREGMVAYLDDEDAPSFYDGSVWGPISVPSVPPAGIGSNVVSAAPTAAFSTTSASFVDITSLNVSITPTSATSKILVILQVGQIRKNANGSAQIRIVRDGSAIYDVGRSETPSGQQGSGSTLVFLDSPATASAVAYKGQAANPGGENTVTMDAFSITAIEVAV
jgi:hypothetical protein